MTDGGGTPSVTAGNGSPLASDGTGSSPGPDTGRAGVVVAGGHSARFGEREKALATLDGRPLLVRAADAACAEALAGDGSFYAFRRSLDPLVLTETEVAAFVDAATLRDVDTRADLRRLRVRSTL